MDLLAQLGPFGSLGLVLAAAAGAAFAAWTILTRLLARAARTPGQFDDDAIRAVRPAFSVLAAVVVLAAGRGVLDAVLERGTATAVQRLSVLLLVVTAAWAAVRLLSAVLERAVARRPRLQPAARLGGRLLSTAIYIVAALTLLSQYGISITPLLTGLGIAALAVGLALQDTISNFFAGVWIQSGRTLQPGHHIRLEDQKVDGTVRLIGWRTTLLRTGGGNTVVIPNAKLAQAIVTDYMWPDSDTVAAMNVRVGYDVPPDKVLAILVEEAKEAAKTVPGMLASPPPGASMNPGFGEYGIDYTLAFHVQEFTRQGDALSEVRRRIWHRFRKEGIAFPYPTRVDLQAPGDDFAPADGHARKPGGRPPPPPPVSAPMVGQQEAPRPPSGDSRT